MSTATTLGKRDPLSESARRLSESKQRVESLAAGHWLRAAGPTQWPAAAATEGHNLAADNTVWRSPSNANLVIAPGGLETPKVEKFVSEQEFEGVVLSVDQEHGTLWARLIDHTAGYPDEEAEFSFDDVPDDDWNLIIPGALFSWNIGREWRDEQVRRVSEVRFRRFFQFSSAKIAQAKERSAHLASLIAEIHAESTGDTSLAG